MILLIGYGNPLCGDDGIGPYAVERLADDEVLSLLPDIDYLAMRQLTPELAEPISRANVVIFVDAAYGEIPGQIACHELVASIEPAKTTPGAFTHHVSATVLLDGTQFLYGQRPTAYLYTVTGENFNLGDAFSSAVEAALLSLLDQLKARITQCTNLVSLKQ